LKDGNGYTLILQDSSEGSLAAHGADQQVISLSSPEDLESLYRRTRNGLYRYKPLQGKKDFFKYLTD